MKTKEEWLWLYPSRMVNERVVQRIQLDAFIAGERFAAKLIRDHELKIARVNWSSLHVVVGEEIILADADTRTSLPEEAK